MNPIDDILKAESNSEILEVIDVFLISLNRNSESLELKKLNELKDFLVSKSLQQQWIQITLKLQSISNKYYALNFELPQFQLSIGDIDQAKKTAQVNLSFFFRKMCHAKFLSYFTLLKDLIELDEIYYAMNTLVRVLYQEENEIESHIFEQITLTNFGSDSLKILLKERNQSGLIPRRRRLILESFISILEIKEMNCSLKGLKKVLNNIFEAILIFGPNNYLAQFLSHFIDSTGLISLNFQITNEKIKNLVRKDFYTAVEYYKKVQIKKIPLESKFDLGNELFESIDSVDEEISTTNEEREFGQIKELSEFTQDNKDLEAYDLNFSNYIKKENLNFETLKELSIALLTAEFPISSGAVIEKMRMLAVNNEQKMLVDYLNAHCLYIFEKYSELETFVNYSISVIPLTEQQKVGYLRLISLSRLRQGKFKEAKSVEKLISKLVTVRIEE